MGGKDLNGETQPPKEVAATRSSNELVNVNQSSMTFGSTASNDHARDITQPQSRMQTSFNNTKDNTRSLVQSRAQLSAEQL